MQTSKEKLIEILKGRNILDKRPVKLKYGGDSNYYVDLKKEYGDPIVVGAVCDALWEEISKTLPKDIKPSYVAGQGHGGIPIATVLSKDHNLKLCLVREEPKRHGINKWIDGYLPGETDYVVIVDDVSTTGKTFLDTYNIIGAATKTNIVGCYAVVKRGKKETEILLPSFHSLLTIEDLLK